MIVEGKVSISTFLSCLLWAGTFLEYFDWQKDLLPAAAFYLTLSVSHLMLLIYVVKKYFQIFWRSYFLGLVFLLGLWACLYTPPTCRAFGIYLCIVAIFHISEYIATACLNPSTLRLDSFLINHSLAYNLAHALCLVEYFIWWWFYPDIKLWTSFQYFGLAVCLFGEVLRKLAMYTAGINFTHLIQYEKRREHVLVTSGIYSFCRHPSYVGWFFWSIGTQILVCNPVCFIGYAAVSWKFFDERIYEEEMLLLNFFGTDYLKYQQRVSTGIPFIKGYQLHSRNR